MPHALGVAFQAGQELTSAESRASAGNGHAHGATRRGRDPRTVSVVLPVFNEVAALRALAESIVDVLGATDYSFEIIFVDDGSSDGSSQLLDELAAANPRVVVLHLSRNFGHQPALQAGLQAARGDAVIVMDSDLQDDPAALPQFLEQWEAGYDVVYAIRTNRQENVVKRALFHLFYRLLQGISQTPIPVDAGNFGLIDRRVAVEVAALPEQSRFYPGLRRWVGFRQIGIAVPRHARYDNVPRVSFWGLVRLAKTAIFSFSTVPLTIFYLIAGASCCVCFALTAFVLYHRLTTGLAIPGWASGIITASFFGTLNALGVAVLGEYVVRIFDQVRARPQFIVGRAVNLQREVDGRTDEFARSGTSIPPAILPLLSTSIGESRFRTNGVEPTPQLQSSASH